jgi:4-aminobutyrate aminotransferase apoenzyme (EC 2.6.1.19)
MNRWIKINGPIPGPKSKEIAERRAKYVADAIGDSLSPCYIAKGKGALVTDVDGNQFIDFTGGWGCLMVGHTPKRVVDAIKDQADKYLHTDFTAIPYEPFVKLAERLATLAPGNTPKKVAFFNSGAEAVENAVKLSRMYTRRKAIVVFENAFHGRTLLTMTMTHRVKPYKYKCGPFAPEIYRFPYPTSYRPTIKIEDFERIMTSQVDPEEVAAVVIEPIQGEGGFQVPTDGFLEYLRALTEKYGIMFVADEVQSGIGRTAKLFAIENWNIEPDLIAVAKSLAAGMPLSAVIGKKEIMDSPIGGAIGGTYVGNPVCCRAAIEVLNIIEKENLLERAKEIGRLEKERLNELKEKHDIVGDVRGIGAMVAVEFVKDRETKEPATEETSAIVKECMKNGVAIASAGVHGNVIRFLNSLVITDEQLEEGFDVLDRAIAKVTGE